VSKAVPTEHQVPKREGGSAGVQGVEGKRLAKNGRIGNELQADKMEWKTGVAGSVGWLVVDESKFEIQGFDQEVG